ncbi:hypothetical protein [Deinococcus ruber]|uniref:Uncharacterized protein n=1 Tax=Deinococcus ruber TaxID=1848197 RepID=A0A918FJ16_9DEIO|nr:hypothetical protein [Deinococcus ruber]GGR40870.1 hypothetical protein GCM10008957_56420 [Deinococcus ruber]
MKTTAKLTQKPGKPMKDTVTISNGNENIKTEYVQKDGKWQKSGNIEYSKTSK